MRFIYTNTISYVEGSRHDGKESDFNKTTLMVTSATLHGANIQWRLVKCNCRYACQIRDVGSHDARNNRQGCVKVSIQIDQLSFTSFIKVNKLVVMHCYKKINPANNNYCII